MKHRSRLLSIAVVPILFSRLARHFFQNDTNLRANNTLCLVSNRGMDIDLRSSSSLGDFSSSSGVFLSLVTCTGHLLNALSMCFQDSSSAVSVAAIEGSLANRLANKRKSVAIPLDSALRRFLQSADEVSFSLSLFIHFLSIAAARVSPFSALTDFPGIHLSL